ncbi:MAG: amidohydrolase family protein [Chloroflexi bacterium]|nr:amidohydrolase family protein [Chloroflexota bacterium]
MAPFIVDADTHVDESESTWEALKGVLAKHLPVTVKPGMEEIDRAGLDPSDARWWLVEGRLQSRKIRDERHPRREFRELEDIDGRLADMDRMGVDVQVLFPTFFIRYGTSNPDAEVALTTTYNRWIAERSTKSGGRLRWTAVLPWLDVDRGIEEMRWAKANGACGVFKRGQDLGKQAGDSYFLPFYEEASALNMPICVHTGNPPLPGGDGDRGFPIIKAFMSLLIAGIPDAFPKLRFGFIEAGASWIPYALAQLATMQRQKELGDTRTRRRGVALKDDLFRSDRLFVTLDSVDRIEHLLPFGLEDSLMIGTDYSHSDPSANIAALQEVQTWADTGKISAAVASKILEGNPRSFYGL